MSKKRQNPEQTTRDSRSEPIWAVLRVLLALGCFGGGAAVTAFFIKREATQSISTLEVEQVQLVATQIDQLLVNHQSELLRQANRLLSEIKQGIQSGSSGVLNEPMAFESDSAVLGVRVIGREGLLSSTDTASGEPIVLGVAWAQGMLPLEADLQARLDDRSSFVMGAVDRGFFSLDPLWKSDRWVTLYFPLDPATHTYALGYVRAEPYLRLLRVAGTDGAVTLMDREGRVLGDTDGLDRGEAFKLIKVSGALNGEVTWDSTTSRRERITYAWVRPGSLVMLWSRSAPILGWSFELKLAQLSLFGLIGWLLVLGSLGIFQRRRRRIRDDLESRQGETTAGAVWVGRLHDTGSSSAVVEAHRILSGIASEFGAKFIGFNGGLNAEFILFWPNAIHVQGAAIRATRAALEWRRQWGDWHQNESSAPSRDSVLFRSAIDWGVCRLNTGIAQLSESPAWWEGQGLQQARKLYEVSAHLGQDILVSTAIWEQVSEQLAGEELSDSLGVKYIKLNGHRDHRGKPVLIEALAPPSVVPVVTEAPLICPMRDTQWMVHNGYQIVGPFDAKEVSRLLVSQDLDFDCRCWPVERGKEFDSQAVYETIASAAIFTNYDGTIAPPFHSLEDSIWVFDGLEIRGPFTDRLKVESQMAQGWFGDRPFVCQGSTVSGWISPFADVSIVA